MIHISIDGENPPEDWCRKAERLSEELKQLDSPEERKRLIEKNKGLWKDLKNWLLKLSHNKCWYSEAREIFSFYDVDHFRPKNCAKQLDGIEREGYWWLAFDWKNFRICGNIGNRPNKRTDGETRGKADYFPLKDGTLNAAGPDCDLRDEMNYLLDPTDINDPLLLTFDESGLPKPVAASGTWDYERAKITIKLLHLDYVLLVDERKRIWSECNRLISNLQFLTNEQANNPSVTRKGEIINIFNKFREMSSEKAVLSSTARACLLSSGNPYTKNLV